MAVIACVDSDVLIDYFDGVDAAAEELSRYDALLISRISWIEVLVGAATPALATTRENFLRRFQMVELSAEVARLSIALRQEHRLRLPDAIVWASARASHALLITRNTKDFPRKHPEVRVPYVLR
ncbi:type II toxin-antitoxin system VapC family toxin [soil metagenome]